MNGFNHFSLAAVMCGLLIFGAAPQSRAQADDPASGNQPADTVFYEILLTDEGVTALDSAGEEWHYDFEKGTFVTGRLPQDAVDAGRPILAGDDISIEDRCTEEKNVKPFAPHIWVGYEEYVDGDVIAYGRVTVKGWVKGDVKSVRKRVLVTESGRVDGDIEAPKVIVRDGAVVLGEIHEVGSPLELKDITRSFSASGLIIVVSFAIALLFFTFLVVSLMPRQVRNFEWCLRQYKAKSFLLGLLFVFLMPAVLVLVMITVVGLLILPLVPLLYVVASCMGIVAFGNVVGGLLARRYMGGQRGLLLQSALGVVLLMALWFIVALLLGGGGDVSEGFGILFLVVSILLTSFPVVGGVGAAILTRFGFKEYHLVAADRAGPGTTAAPEPAPPPIPDGPPSGTPPPSPPSRRATPPQSSRIPGQGD